MGLARYSIKKLLYGIPLILGVTLISFTLMVYFGPDKTYELLGKNPSPEQIAEIRTQLGYDRPFLVRYGEYLRELATLDFGLSDSSGEKVKHIIARTAPVSFALLLPGFILGNLLAIALALLAGWKRGQWLDKTIMSASVVGMSICFVIVIIAFQVLLSTPYGLNWFPVYGWEVRDIPSYFYYVTVPTLAMVFVTLGYNTRFYRAVVVEELSKDYVRTARAFGTPTWELLFKAVLKNSLIPISTKILFSIPVLVISGSLLIESYFGIPGIGKATFDAISSGDQPVLKAIVGLTAVLFVIITLMSDVVYRAIDHRVELK